MTTPATGPILLCYDRSDGARRAIETSAALFPGRDAIVLHVWNPIAVIAAAYGGVVSLPSYDDEEVERVALQLAEEGATVATAAGLSAKAVIAEGTLEGASQAILDVAERHDVALIVLGARGLSTFRSILLGSVSHGVAQHAHRPVLIVPPAV